MEKVRGAFWRRSGSTIGMDPPCDYVFDGVDVRAEVSASRSATPQELVALATAIWKEVKASGVGKDDDAGNDALLKRLQEEYRDFGQSFPLVLRWMVQVRSYHPKAFEKYLLQHSGLRLDSREDFLKLQAEYLVCLFRAKVAHADEREVKQYRENIIRALLEEDEEFMRVSKEVDEEMEKRAQAVDKERRQSLYQALLAERLRRSRPPP